LQDIDLSVARMERRSNSQLQAMAEIAKSSGNISASTLRQKLVFSISRNVNGSFQDIVANENTEIKPGDILRVELDMSRIGGGSPS
jgi:polysaccharide export outer membrane protein